MSLDLASVQSLVGQTLRDPRSAAARLLGMGVPDDGRWLGFVIVIVLSVIVGQISILLMGDGAMGGGLLFMAMFQASILLGMVVAVQGVGRVLGGKGDFPDTLLLVAWLQFVMLVFQMAQIVALVIVPPVFGLLTLLALGWFMWMLTNFIMVLHGFTSALKVAVGIIFCFFAMAVGLAILLSLLGLAPTEM